LVVTSVRVHDHIFEVLTTTLGNCSQVFHDFVS
jgi:hypothetical protein